MELAIRSTLHIHQYLILKIQKFLRGFYLHETSQSRSFAKIRPSRYDTITLSFTDEGKPCSSHELLKSQIWLLTLAAKIKFSRKFLNSVQLCTTTWNTLTTKYFKAVYFYLSAHQWKYWRIGIQNSYMCMSYYVLSCI